ncbi:MAG: hypothetical protein MPN21_16275 [Thermoanaerobaculia bacterium]|nr:hypothetical protein [Thermoanaerobaculia bacterium]
MLPSSSTLARIESLFRPLVVRLPTWASLRLYSYSRPWFLRRYVQERPEQRVPPESLHQRLWGVRFQAPLFNAAGMFKSGDGYELVARQGAGAWLAGTTTATPRHGNDRHGVRLPFAPYPTSGAASNWLGLPNPGHAEVARRLGALDRIPGCPVGVSLAFDPDPDQSDERKLDGLIAGLEHYVDAGVDFLEINESCPNTEESANGHGERDDLAHLESRLTQIRDRFLQKRGASLPTILKLSNDADPADVPRIVDLASRLGFAGLNFGNTSTAYAALREQIQPAERRLYDRFSDGVRGFGGGVSGRPLRARSLHLVGLAAAHLRNRPPEREFHLIRTGGVEMAEDLHASSEAGAPLSQWYTGYFEAFARDGHDLYRRLFDQLDS